MTASGGTSGGSGAGSSSGSSSSGSTGGGMLVLPPEDGGLDYQLGGAYPPPNGVQIVSRDRLEAPAGGIYNICYVNGFQAQPGEEGWWETNYPELILRDNMGDPVIDQDWNEMLLDPSTSEKRTALAGIVGGWIDQCAQDGFAAIEIDNLDSYTRSQGLLIEDDAVSYMALLSAAAHAQNLPIAQKNAAELVGRRDEMGTDFVVAEECNSWSECDVYIESYGTAVLMIEYDYADFMNGCGMYPNYSIVLRDVDLTTPGDPSYVFEQC
jgi:hypothetical protein